MEHPTFVADVHLGKLAKALRLLGFDTLYSNAYTPTQLLEHARGQNRVLLSRSVAFSKHTDVCSVVIQSADPDKQVRLVVQQYSLTGKGHPFSRCLLCNGVLEPVEKETIAAQLLPNTRLYFNQFWQCKDCHRVYWKGSHYDRMLRLIEKVKKV